MSLIKCKECGNEVSNTSKTCPKCGAKVPSGNIGCGGAIGIVIVIAIIASIFSGPSTDNSSSGIPDSPSQGIAPASDNVGESTKPEDINTRIERIRSLKIGKCTPPLKWVKKRITKNPEWPDEIIAHSTCNSVVIGMSQDQAIAAWGRPHDINRSTYSFGVHEQWVYGEYGDGGYLYFEDGRLTSIQN